MMEQPRHWPEVPRLSGAPRLHAPVASWLPPVALALMVALFPGSLPAQSQSQRVSFQMLRDSLSGVTDSTPLLALEQRTIAVAKRQRDDPAIHIRLALIAQRLGEIGRGADHFNDAGSEGEWATDLAKDWPWAWYVLGQAELALQQQTPPAAVGIAGLQRSFDVDHQAKAEEDFQRALAYDPGFVPALHGLADAVATDPRPEHRALVLNALRAAAATGTSRSGPLLLTRGEIEREAGDPDSALVAYRQYRARGGDEALAVLEEAKTLFALNRPAEAQAVYDSATDLLGSDTSVADMRADLSWIADSAELAAYDTLQPGQYGTWIRKFWSRRDLADARKPGERLAEHYRRLFYILAHFRRPGVYREADIIFRYHSSQRLVDDRGVIYMRHGPPDEIASALEQDVPPNVSWLYHRPEGDIILHFRTASGARDYRLIESLADLYGFETAHWLQTGAFDQGPYEAGPAQYCAKGSIESDKCKDLMLPLRSAFASRSGLDPVYDQIADGLGEISAMPALRDERAAGQASIAVATTTDDDPLHFARRLPASVQRFGLATDGGGRILVSLGVRAGDLVPVSQGGRTTYPLGIRVYAEGADATVRLIDTTAAFSTDTPYPADRLLAWTTTVPAAPGPARLTVALAAGGTRSGIARRWDSVPVPDLSASQLTMSDLVTGQPGMGVWYPLDSDTLILNPVDAWPTSGRMTVYYQLGGLQPGRSYRTGLEVVQLHRGVISRMLGNQPRAIQVSFQEPATGPTVHITRTLTLADLKPGPYRLTVTVTGPDGTEIVRTTDFQVTE